MFYKTNKLPWVASVAFLAIAAISAIRADAQPATAVRAERYYKAALPNYTAIGANNANVRAFSDITSDNVSALFNDTNRVVEVRGKAGQMTAAFNGVLLGIDQDTFMAVSKRLGVEREDVGSLVYNKAVGAVNYKKGREFFLTNHTAVPFLFAIRGKALGTAMTGLDDAAFRTFITNSDKKDVIRDINGYLSDEIGNVFVPVGYFTNALAAFGATVTPNMFYTFADANGFAATAEESKLVNAAFGMAVVYSLATY